MPKVSVIIPTYNRSHIVGEAIESVLAQTYQDFEIIVVDDASTDNSREVLDGYVARYPGKIRVIYRETNGGAGAARNDGIRASASEFIAFLDSDDLYLPRRLEVGITALESKQEYGASYVDLRVLGQDGRVVIPSHLRRCGGHRSGWILRWLLRRQLISIDTITIRRSVLRQIGMFDESLSTGEDTPFLWSVARVAPIIGIPEALVLSRESEGSLSERSATRERKIFMLRCWARGETSFLVGWSNAPPPIRRMIARRIWSLHSETSRLLCVLGRREEARDAAMEARKIASAYGLFMPRLFASIRDPIGRIINFLLGVDFALHKYCGSRYRKSGSSLSE